MVTRRLSPSGKTSSFLTLLSSSFFLSSWWNTLQFFMRIFERLTPLIEPAAGTPAGASDQHLRNDQMPASSGILLEAVLTSCFSPPHRIIFSSAGPDSALCPLLVSLLHMTKCRGPTYWGKADSSESPLQSGLLKVWDVPKGPRSWTGKTILYPVWACEGTHSPGASVEETHFSTNLWSAKKLISGEIIIYVKSVWPLCHISVPVVKPGLLSLMNKYAWSSI